MWSRIFFVLLGFVFIVGCQLSENDKLLDSVETAVPTTPNCNPAPNIRQFPITPWPNTDFCQHSLPYDEFRYGGVGKDRIAPLNNPAIETIAQADSWITPQEPVLVLRLDGITRAYPLSILLWHEIVNDELNGRSILITYCPLCNSGLAFERSVTGQTLDFGTTGILHNANLVMYDHQTESWWQQLSGTAVVGELIGTQLPLLPTRLVSWQTFKDEFPSGDVLSIFTGYDRRYGENPYINYDSLVSQGTKFYDGVLDERLHPKMRVIGLQIGAETIAYPYSALEEYRVINHSFSAQQIVVFWQPGTQSPLYAQFISESKEVGSAAVFSREVAGQLLTFAAQADGFVDVETGSEWTFWGTAVSGPLLGAQLEQLPGHELFWFAWAAQHPDTALYRPAN